MEPGIDGVVQDVKHLNRSGQHTGAFFPMADFEQRIMDDPDVLGMMYVGSQGRGDGDRYSDLDIIVWVREEVLDTPGIQQHYMGWLGELHFMMVLGTEGSAFIGPDWQSAELDVVGESRLHPSPYLREARVVKDSEGRLAGVVAASPPETPVVTPERARQVIEELIHMLVMITCYNNRGSYLAAAGMSVEQATSLYDTLARLRSHEPYEVRFCERFLRPHEYALLSAAWPARPEYEEIRRSTRALWDWGQHVWAEAEQTLGVSLGIVLDREDLPAALERIYTWAQEK